MKIEGGIKTNFSKVMRNHGLSDECLVEDITILVENTPYKINVRFGDYNMTHDNYVLMESTKFSIESCEDMGEDQIKELFKDSKIDNLLFVIFERNVPNEIKDKIYFEMDYFEIYTKTRVIKFDTKRTKIDLEYVK